MKEFPFFKIITPDNKVYKNLVWILKEAKLIYISGIFSTKKSKKKPNPFLPLYVGLIISDFFF